MSTKKKKRKKKKAAHRQSRAPFILLCLVVAGAAGVLLVQNSSPTSGQPDSISVDTGVTTTVVTLPAPTSTPVAITPDTGPVTDVATSVPVTVHNDALGDIVGDTVIDDYTEVTPPEVVSSPLTVDPALYSGDRIDGVLPDGIYHARAFNTFEEDQQGVNFDIPDANGGVDPHLYPAFLDQLIFVSLVDTRNEGISVSVSPSTFFTIIDERVAESPEWFQLTVVDGAVIAAEAFIPR